MNLSQLKIGEIALISEIEGDINNMPSVSCIMKLGVVPGLEARVLHKNEVTSIYEIESDLIIELSNTIAKHFIVMIV